MDFILDTNILVHLIRRNPLVVNLIQNKAKKLFLMMILIILSISTSFSQMQSYTYKREISGIKDTWHSLTLPNEVYGKLRPDLLDIRIYGITDKNDTLEVPYLSKTNQETHLEKEIAFRLINTAHNAKGYYFTFDTPEGTEANEIFLDIDQNNFDWQLKLEGSNNQQEWFTLTENYRILAIKNMETNYRFTKIVFPDAQYRYFRININSDIQPTINAAKINKQSSYEGIYRTYKVESTKTELDKKATQYDIHSDLEIEVDKKAKQTIIQLDLGMPVPVSYLKFAVKNDFDYYRPILIQYIADSVNTQNGYVYSYRSITTRTLTSLEKNEITFNNIVCQKLKITIENRDNEPLTIDSVSVKGNPNELIARFTQKANYYLVYGNDKAQEPNYDIAIFQDKIPTNLQALTLGDEQTISKASIKEKEPLFKNKAWLWGIMIVIIAVLGLFSFRMIRNK